ncbi:hypothetical protein SDC9_201278 [bioreactor metagenome]|uniref:Uncharacterized protein n=1 Tax=bioreactor metagenome TaxID=1076179 RepID=A0A645IZE3_9ZZZZ
MFNEDGAVLLIEGFAAHGVLLPVLGDGGRHVGLLVEPYRIEIRQQNAVPCGVRHPNDGAADVVQRLSGGKPGRNLNNRGLPHAVDQYIGTAVKQDGAAHCVVPIIVVGKPAQRCLNAADDNRHPGGRRPNGIRVDNDRPVRPAAGNAARSVGVLRTAAAGGGIVVDHGVNSSGVN